MPGIKPYRICFDGYVDGACQGVRHMGGAEPITMFIVHIKHFGNIE